MNPSIPSTPVTPSSTEDKTTAIVGYLTLIGFIVAIILHGSKKTRLGAFHLRQSLGLMLTAIAISIIAVIPFVGWLVWIVGWIALLVFWIMGLIAAINGELKPVPVLGEHFQKWFGTAFD